MNDFDDKNGKQFGDSDGEYWGCLLIAAIIIMFFIAMLAK